EASTTSANRVLLRDRFMTLMCNPGVARSNTRDISLKRSHFAQASMVKALVPLRRPAGSSTKSPLPSSCSTRLEATGWAWIVEAEKAYSQTSKLNVKTLRSTHPHLGAGFMGCG